MTVTPNPDAWFLSADGVPHDPAGARMATFLSSGPKRGIVPAGPQASGAVRPMSTPSNRGLVLPFVGVAPNPAAGHFGEAYVFRSRTSKEFTLRAASSGGPRTDAIISRVWDEGMFPQHPMPGDDYVTVEVIEDVDPGVESANTLAAQHQLDYPFIWHGNVTLPASENVVTAGRITDRRARIGGQTFTETRSRSGDIGPQVLNDREGQRFPSRGGQHTIYVPEWATRMTITAEWLGIQYRNLVPDGPNVYGSYYVRYGGAGGTQTYETNRPYFDAPLGSGAVTDTWKIQVDVPVPEELQGTHQPFHLYGQLGSGAPVERVTIQERSQTILNVEFKETLV